MTTRALNLCAPCWAAIQKPGKHRTHRCAGGDIAPGGLSGWTYIACECECNQPMTDGAL